MSSILFVCLGNICRSPLAAAVARRRFAEAGIAMRVDSCGTGGWHAGEGADPRAVEVAHAAGYQLSDHRARQLSVGDFTGFDRLLAMDGDNLAVLNRRNPAPGGASVQLFLAAAGLGADQSVPDPYQGDLGDFRAVLALAEQGVDGLIRQLRHAPAEPDPPRASR